MNALKWIGIISISIGLIWIVVEHKKKGRNYKSIIWLIPMSFLWLFKIFTEKSWFCRYAYIAAFVLSIVAIAVNPFVGHKNINKNNNKTKS